MTSKRVCVYCASSDASDEKFLLAGRQLGEGLARLNMTIVYGGAQCGVMGAVADGALSAQGKVIGWIPTFMKTEILHPGLTEVHEVESMHIRKHGMMTNSDALIALPGGPGTIEELMEAITWRRLKLIGVPIFIINLDGYYNPLLELFENMRKACFIVEGSEKDWNVVDTVDEVIEKLKLML
ncbi:unnamed protein product [Adineta ricciae]|uniref:Cytokinin riboside 5'-monophosphate phosphoribohydrolase n=1 Tax=Adineta ricciae TaxID=249248 RepID=A0A815Q479_ADIRI|nr:unnamed protein product [Adineta ricciae]